MLRGGYAPAMVPMVTPQGPISALAFVSNPAHPSYVGELPLGETASLIASGKGILGTNREYLVQLATQLEALGIDDPYVQKLHAQISSGRTSRHPDASARRWIIAIVRVGRAEPLTPRTMDMGKPRMTEGTKSHYEVIVVGAGVAGIYQIKRLADLGIDATVLDAAPDLGGTWYWNRYPGAASIPRATPTAIRSRGNCSTSGTGRSAFPASPRTCAISITSPTSSTCANTCSSTARSRRRSSTRRSDLWRLKLDDGRELTCRFVILAIGLLSAPTLPRLEGMDEFQGALVPHLPLAARAGRTRRQEGRHHRHRRHRHSGDRRDRRQGRRTHRIPAAAELERAAQQQPDLR